MSPGCEGGPPVSEEPGRERVIAGRYRLLSPLGAGGMGTVWRARDEVLRREVAVKEVRAPAGLSPAELERLYARLEREAWAAARVADRGVVTVYDVAHQDGRPWIVMELVRGIALSDLLDAQGPLPPRRAAAIGADVLSALRAAHAAGVLHRDVKPANVLLADDGRVVLTDFGIATVEGSSALTMTGEVIGSPEFLAPERALGRTPGPESDLWSLGVLLYAAVEGHSPFRRNTPLNTLRAAVDEELPPPRRAGPLAPVIEGLLRKDPAERIPAPVAEQELRIIGTGGPRTGGAAATAPTVAAFPGGSPAPAPTVPAPEGATRPVHPDGPGPPTRGRGAAVAVVAGVAALALALAGVTYGLVHHGNDGGGGSPRASGGARTPGGSADGPAPGGSGPSTGAGPVSPGAPTAGGGGSTADRSAQSVRVTVTGARTDYSGPCPPSRGEAPVFTATFTVGRLPAEVSYRWVTTSGRVSDPGWRTLSFPAGGGRTGQQRVVVTTYDPGGSLRSAIGVEVRSPVRTASGTVPFSVSCETETPTGGASPSDS
ncbi:serine/threonine-protein kinase [Streptomyces sp. NPDC052040]|uniref:serine/threonine-protein kinase n=1 Tax=unclassified Streptomyces TaxID=2593676 RepID=UPI0037D8BA43